MANVIGSLDRFLLMEFDGKHIMVTLLVLLLRFAAWSITNHPFVLGIQDGMTDRGDSD
jgi:hypothetical protein